MTPFFSTTSTESKLLTLFAFAFFCCAAVTGAIGLTLFIGAIDSSWAVLFVLPVLCVAGGIFFLNRRSLFFMIMVLRSSVDLILEATRGGTGGAGLGGIINISVVLLAFSYVAFDTKKMDKVALYPWAAFFLACAYGVFLSTVKFEAIRIATNWLSNCAIFICVLHNVKSSKDFITCIKLVVLSSVLPAMYGLYEMATNWRNVGSTYRLQSTFTHANIFAFYLTLVIVLTFYLLKSQPWKRFSVLRLASFFHMAVLLGLLVLTQTRSAWLGVVFFFLMYALFFEKKYLLYLSILGGIGFFIPAVQERLFDLASGIAPSHQENLNSFAWRLELWRSALDWMAPARSFFGYGLGQFKELSSVFFSHGGGIKWDAHNAYMQWFFDIGLVGLLTYIGLQIKVFTLVVGLRSFDRLAMFTVTMIIVTYAIMSFSDNMTFYLVFNWYYWFTLGAAVALQLHVSEKRTLNTNAASTPFGVV